MSTIKPFPELVAYAEAEARARQDGLAARWPSMEACPPPTWASMGDERALLVEVEVDLLCDLTRDASYDAVVRLAAARLRVPAHAVHQAVEDACGDAWPLLPAALRGEIKTTFDNQACLAAIVAWLWRNEG